MRVALIGANGFVGSAFARLLAGAGVEVLPVTRQDYAVHAGTAVDVVVDAAGNSRKYWAEQLPFEEFDASVGHKLRVLRDFPAPWHLHISSVDVYNDLASPETTREDTPFDPARSSKYGLHKKIAEDLVRGHAAQWLIVRLAGMVGPGLRKNPVYDLLHGQAQRIHPNSQYQFMSTDDAARLAWDLVRAGVRGEIFNICGRGLISPREMAALAGLPLNIAPEAPAEPRIVHVSTEKISRLAALPETRTAVAAFLSQAKKVSPDRG